MSRPLDHIKASIAAELEEFELKFRQAMKSSTPLLDTIMTYIVKRKGKQVRPMFVFLSASLFTKQIEEKTHRGAALVELLHTATLVHDDVVDDAEERRGFFSINALWKNKIAVLVGDYLLSKGLLLSIENDDFRLLKIVSEAVRQMSEGELLQIEKTRKLDITEEVYFEIITKKTASLIASCCAIGAASAGQSDEIVEQMRLFGEKAGIAFQIKDDLLDYQLEDTGKPKGIDLKEKKLTLPVIYTLNNANKQEKRMLINTIKNHHENKKRIAEVMEHVKNKGGLEYSKEVMIQYKEEALSILKQIPCDETYAGHLKELVQYIINRKH